MKLAKRELTITTPSDRYQVLLQPGWRKSHVSMWKDVWPSIGGRMAGATVRNDGAVELWLLYVDKLTEYLSDHEFRSVHWPWPEPCPWPT